MSDERSPATRFVDELVRVHGSHAAARAEFVRMAESMTVVEQAAVMLDWREFWARPKQLAPEGRWRSWGFLTARAFGKTEAICQFINAEIDAGRARMIGFAAQNLQRTKGMQVPALIATAPPWNRPEWIDSKELLVWPNGAKGLALTPEVPGAIRGDNYDLSWICELQSWPTATMEEAFTNFFLSTRVGLARVVWDCTPKKRHPLLLDLLASAEADPENNRIVRGTSYENAANLAAGVLADLERRIGGTNKGKEELLGEMLSEEEGATCEQSWIDDNRRPRPPVLVRTVISIDPSTTERAGSDENGINVSGIDHGKQVYVVADLTRKCSPQALADLVLDTYVAEGCDLVVVETNKIGLYATQNLRAAAQARNLSVVVVDKNWIPCRMAGTVFVRETFARGEKSERAEPAGIAYQQGRVSHVIGADLAKLEQVLTTWVPQHGRKVRSPDRLDALVGSVVELLGLDMVAAAPNPKTAFTGIVAASQALQGRGQSAQRPLNMATLLGGNGRPRGI